MEQGVDSPVILVIKAPDQKYDDQTINCFLNWTVEKLKTHLSHVYPSKPRSKDQRLVYSGKLLQDHCKLRDVLRKQDEFHMLHLVCASRSPPPSPSTTRRRNSNKNRPTNAGSADDNVQPASSEETPDRLTQNPAPVHTGPFQQRFAWGEWTAQHVPSARMPHYPMYNPMTLLWWQQLYAWHYHTSYQAWAASLRPPQEPTPPLDAPPRDGIAHDNPHNAPAGDNEEDLNRDWLDWVYAASRAAVLLSIVYFYSSFSRFVMVMGAMLLLYLHQAGWLPFNLDNELQDLQDPLNQDDLNPENPNDLNEMERLADEGEDDEEHQEEITDEADGGINAGFLSSAWSFITTFFASLIPEGIPNPVN